MNKVALIACSTSGIDYISGIKYTDVMRMTLQFNNKEYVDYIDITAEDFYKKMIEDPEAKISTSQVSTGIFLEAYEKLKSNGYTDIIVITVSSKLSGTFQSAKLASDMIEDINIHLIDSKSVSFGEAALVLKGIELIDKNLPAKQIVVALNEIIKNIKIYVIVDTLKYLVKNGRLSVAAGFLGSLLKIKPLLTLTPEGELKPFEKIRTLTKAQQRAIDLILEETQSVEAHYFIAYTSTPEKAEEIKNTLLTAKPNSKVTIIPLTPVVGAHAGPGTIGIGYLKI